MTNPDFARYAIRHPDGRWLYHLPRTDPHTTIAILADGQPLTQIGTTHWWATDHEATRITTVTKTSPKTTKYVLEDPDTASVKYPAELTVEQWQERRQLNGGTTPERLWELYRSITVEQPPTETHIDGTFTVLEGGEPPAPGGPTWTVNLLDSITQRPEYQHLFPGRLHGLREHIIALIKRMPRVTHCFDGFQDSTAVYVDLRVPYEQPETRFVRDISHRTGKTLKTGRNRPVTVSRTLHLPIPTTVTGDNYAAALAEWDRQVAFWTQAVADANVAACNHCRGTGHVPTGAEQYTASK
ncbi:hypothetical protein [Streptomyces sp.]|uniref:hypothetical protein n=1 Tax=Streptomyces sp. TaxID=1931 RepID=UPI002F3E8DB7